jgi:hypothetical protein
MEGMNNFDFEIIIVGGNNISGKNITHIPFDDSPKISLKKNLITEKSKKENIVFMHDYFVFNKNWYNGYLQFGNDWEICMNVILNSDGNRFRDWVTWDDKPNMTINGHRGLLVPYTYNKFEYMYISGGYWVAKKEVMVNTPLNSSLDWSECEDLEWSKRALRKHSYKMNQFSCVHVVKPFKNTVFESYSG